MKGFIILFFLFWGLGEWIGLEGQITYWCLARKFNQSIKIMFLEEVENAVRLGIKSTSGTTGFQQKGRHFGHVNFV